METNNQITTIMPNTSIYRFFDTYIDKSSLFKLKKDVKTKINLSIKDLIETKQITLYIKSPYTDKYNHQPYRTYSFDLIGSMQSNIPESKKNSWTTVNTIYCYFVEYFNKNEFDFIFEVANVWRINNEPSVFYMKNPYINRIDPCILTGLLAIPKKVILTNSTILTIKDLNQN